MVARSSVRSYLGIAKEVTKGTAVAPTAFIPVAQGKLKPVDIIDPLFDEGLRGSNVKTYNYIPGRVHSTFDFGGPVFPDTIPWAIAGLMGAVTTTGASAPYTHVMSLKNSTALAADTQPTSFTLYDFYTANARQYAGCQVHDFSLSFNADGMIEYDAKATGWASATTTAATPSFTTVLPTPVWQGTVTIGGTAVSTAVEGKIDVKRAVSAIYGIANTQNPYQIFVGPLEVTGSFKFIMDDDTELTRFLTNTQPSITLDWSNGAGASATQLAMTLTKGAYHAAVIDRSKDHVEIDVEITGIANTTDAGSTGGYSPIKFTAKNAVASGTYQ
jgi:hypothetical protein